MKADQLNVHIVADSPLIVQGLKRRLTSSFGSLLNIRCYYDLKRCTKEVTPATSIIISDYFVGGISSIGAIDELRRSNPSVYPIMYSSTRDVISAIEAVIHCRFITPPVFPVFRYSHSANLKLK
jgi:DNA-binding NarL/FixJ family response regulator